MSKIIIGIHGMGNKPAKKTLMAWWKAPIREGFKRISAPKRAFRFELVYWAHYLHPVALQAKIKDKKHPLYIDEPYFHGDKNATEEEPSALRQKILSYLGSQLQKLFLNEDFTINYESVTDFITHHFFSDLEKYYTDYCVENHKTDCRAKVLICTALADLLKKHRRKKILLIAHSMGSIIAFDVLTQYVPEIPIDTFVTIGSPLGLPVVKSKIAAEREKDFSQPGDIRTPENVWSNWYNLSDLRDKIAINYNLSDDFQKNARGVGPVDRIVSNNYEFMGEKNPHKVYGYLRTSQMAEILSGFLG